MPNPKTARFYALLGAPPDAIDREQARAYHIEIMTWLDAAGPPDEPCPDCVTESGAHSASCGHCHGSGRLTTAPWTRSERAALLRLEKRWRRRALGYDKRWLVAGLKTGRLPREVEEAIAPPIRKRPDPAWTGE